MKQKTFFWLLAGTVIAIVVGLTTYNVIEQLSDGAKIGLHESR